MDWPALMTGAAIGTLVSGCFFVGLALGMRLALRSGAPVLALAISAALRIVLLLVLGWYVVAQGGPWAGLGFAAAFLVLRLLATTYMRIAPVAGGAP
jgi:hypothetical protein